MPETRSGNRQTASQPTEDMSVSMICSDGIPQLASESHKIWDLRPSCRDISIRTKVLNQEDDVFIPFKTEELDENANPFLDD